MKIDEIVLVKLMEPIENYIWEHLSDRTDESTDEWTEACDDIENYIINRIKNIKGE